MRKGFRRNKGRQHYGQAREGRDHGRWFSSGRRGIYRARNGVIMGVCRGIADYFDIPVTWVRLACVVILFFSGLWPMIGIYIIASFIMKPRPVKPIETEDEKDFYDNYINSRQGAIRTLKTRFSALERRIRRIEDSVTTREFEWDRKFNS